MDGSVTPTPTVALAGLGRRRWGFVTRPFLPPARLAPPVAIWCFPLNLDADGDHANGAKTGPHRSRNTLHLPPSFFRRDRHDWNVTHRPIRQKNAARKHHATSSWPHSIVPLRLSTPPKEARHAGSRERHRSIPPARKKKAARFQKNKEKTARPRPSEGGARPPPRQRGSPPATRAAAAAAERRATSGAAATLAANTRRCSRQTRA